MIKNKLGVCFFVSWYKQGNNWFNLCWNYRELEFTRNFWPDNFLMWKVFGSKSFFITHERDDYRASSVWYARRDLSRTNGFQFSSKCLLTVTFSLTKLCCISNRAMNCDAVLPAWVELRPGLFGCTEKEIRGPDKLMLCIWENTIVPLSSHGTETQNRSWPPLCPRSTIFNHFPVLPPVSIWSDGRAPYFK